jgi:hypothetical protein
MKSHANATSRRCASSFLGHACERVVDAEGLHHGKHVALDGTLRWSDGQMSACDDHCFACRAEHLRYLRIVARTGVPALFSRERSLVDRGVWTRDDARDWARRELGAVVGGPS